MRVCGQALRFFTGLQRLIKRVTAAYVRSMRAHDITQTFWSEETRRSLRRRARVSPPPSPTAPHPPPQEWPSVRTAAFGVGDLLNVRRLRVLAILSIFQRASLLISSGNDGRGSKRGCRNTSHKFPAAAPQPVACHQV